MAGARFWWILGLGLGGCYPAGGDDDTTTPLGTVAETPAETPTASQTTDLPQATPTEAPGVASPTPDGPTPNPAEETPDPTAITTDVEQTASPDPNPATPTPEEMSPTPTGSPVPSTPTPNSPTQEPTAELSQEPDPTLFPPTAVPTPAPTEVAQVTPGDQAKPDFHLYDLNKNSVTYNQPVSPRDYLQQVSAWYFGHAT